MGRERKGGGKENTGKVDPKEGIEGRAPGRADGGFVCKFIRIYEKYKNYRMNAASDSARHTTRILPTQVALAAILCE